VQVTETVQTNEGVEVVEIAPTTKEVQKADQNAQDAEENQLFSDQNIDQNASNEPVMSADPVPLASRSLPFEEVQLMAQTTQNVNISSSTMGSITGASNFLVSDFPTPNTIPLNTLPPPPIKTTDKLPNMSALFDSLNTFVTAIKEKVEASGAAAPAKPSKAEKIASRELRVSIKTHKIACVLTYWTFKVHAPGLAIPPPVFEDPTVFD